MPLFTRRRCMSVFFALFWRDGEVMKIVTFFIWVFEIPPFWSDLGRGLRWWKSWPFLSDCLRLLHSDQIWGGVWGDENRDLFYLTVWDPSILIRFGGRGRWWKSWPSFIWLFEIPPFWSDLGRGLRWWKSWPLLSDCLRFLHSDQIWAEGWGDEIRDLFLSDCLRGSSILIRYGGRVRWWWGNFIWLFEEIPPFWSDLGWGDENRDLFLSDCLRFLHSD